VWTIGHSTRTLPELVDLLRTHDIRTLVDVRTVPRSRRHPHFTKDALAESLPQAAIAYVHMPGLGGLRKARADSLNTGWRTDAFRGYADYMQTEEFARHLDALMALDKDSRLGMMCAEAEPWRCHRTCSRTRSSCVTSRFATSWDAVRWPGMRSRHGRSATACA
jgi:uncharacterized protein (DUF488 family)